MGSTRPDSYLGSRRREDEKTSDSKVNDDKTLDPCPTRQSPRTMQVALRPRPGPGPRPRRKQKIFFIFVLTSYPYPFPYPFWGGGKGKFGCGGGDAKRRSFSSCSVLTASEIGKMGSACHLHGEEKGSDGQLVPRRDMTSDDLLRCVLTNECNTVITPH